MKKGSKKLEEEETVSIKLEGVEGGKEAQLRSLIPSRGRG